MAPLLLSALGIIAVLIYLLARAINQIQYLRDDLEQVTVTEHAKCMGAVMNYVGNEFAAQVLSLAAEDYDSVIEQDRAQRLARLHHHPDGPSVPAIWLENRANRLRVLTDYESEPTA